MKTRSEHNALRMKLLSDQVNNTYLREISTLTSESQLSRYRGDVFDRFLSAGINCSHLDVKSVSVIPIVHVKTSVRRKESTSAFFSVEDRRYPFDDLPKGVNENLERFSLFEDIRSPVIRHSISVKNVEVNPPPETKNVNNQKYLPDFDKYSITPLIQHKRANTFITRDSPLQKIGVRPIEEDRNKSTNRITQNLKKSSYNPVTEGLRFYGLSTEQTKWKALKTGEMDVGRLWKVTLPSHYLPPMAQLAHELEYSAPLKEDKIKESKQNFPPIQETHFHPVGKSQT